MINVLFAAGAHNWQDYQQPLADAFREQGLEVALFQDASDLPADHVDYIIYAPGSPLQDFRPFSRCKAVLSLWAGVEKIVGNQTLTQPLCRMVDPGLTQGMVEWVLGHTLRYHLALDATLEAQNGVWAPEIPPLASERPVTILGLGALGQACAQALTRVGFDVTGWSRRPKSIAGLRCLHGPDGLQSALKTAEILVLLLPGTQKTENILNQTTLAQLPKGASILNPGRGTLIDDTALLEALDSGHIARATLDVFRQEPLPAPHPFWAHPKVTVTPHIAADTRASSAARVLADNIFRNQTGQALRHLVDRTAGY